MKKIMVALMLFSLAAAGCGKQPAVQQKEPTEKIKEAAETEKDSTEEIQKQGQSEKTMEEKGYNEIIINGTKLALPCKYSQLEELGFKIMYGEGETVFAHQTLFAIMNLGEDAYVLQFSCKEPEKEAPVEESDLVSFEWDAENVKETSIRFYGGINQDSTEEEVKALLPQVETAGEGRTQYQIQFDKMGYSGMEVIFLDGKIARVTIKNYADYME